MAAVVLYKAAAQAEIEEAFAAATGAAPPSGPRFKAPAAGR